MGSSTENSAFGPTRNPHDLVARAGRLERRLGGRGRRRVRAARARLRHRRLDPPARGAVRRRRREADVRRWCRATGSSRSRRSLDQIGPFAHDGRRRRAAARGDRRPRPVRLDVDRRRRTRRCSPVVDRGVEGLRVGIVEELTDADGIQPEVRGRGRAAAARALEKAGATVDRVSVPSPRYGLSAYYLIAPAEASSNLARYDGVRYGLRVDGADVADDERAHARRRLRPRGEAPDHARHLRAVGRLLRRVLRAGAARPHADHPRLRRARTSSSTCCSSPTSPTVAFELGAKTADPLAMYLSDVCTIPSNLAGHAAMQRAVRHRRGAACPIGVQVLAPALGEPVMFRVARVLGGRRRERDRDRRPTYGDRDRPRGALRAGHGDASCSAAARTSSATSPTRNVCPVCLGLPGSLPVLNERAVEYALRVAEALHLRVPEQSIVLAQELLLSRHAEGLPDLAVRRADHDRRLARRRRRARRHRRARTSRKTPASRCTSAAAVASTTPTTRSSTTTAPACRCSRS